MATLISFVCLGALWCLSMYLYAIDGPPPLPAFLAFSCLSAVFGYAIGWDVRGSVKADEIDEDDGEV